MTSNYLCLSTDITNGDVAAWVQIIVSIAAIFAAYSAIKLQIQSTQKSRQKSILAIAEAAQEHTRRIGIAVANAESNFPMELAQAYDKTVIAGMVQALGNIPLHEVASRDGVMALLSLRDQFAFLGIAVDKFIDGPINDTDMREAIDSSGLTGSVEQIKTVNYCRRRVLNDNVQVHVKKINDDYALLQNAIEG